ncbi:MAG: hypothetical protein COA96_03825 [SAR86 cluster bacterium]|uniref:Uncharacterized protein n=1 Tax=SAR86 cluster bacterium TaxID=2030880 RepID=A0A2A5B6D1_9GAMM|nr:MAG: hypothetical protein COA96_03825 [SAR86 cluster bacterium]
MKILLLLIISPILVSCVEAGLNFERMSEAELAAYNADKSLGQTIVCTEDTRSFSRVRRRECATVEKMYGSAEQASRLGILNTNQN